MELTIKQRAIFDHIEASNDNFLILGKPGVGKSVLTNALVERGVKRYDVAAPTGLAAININGKTLHSMFKIPVFENGIIPDTMPIPDKRDMLHLHHIKHLIIDEISMVRADLFDYIDRVLKDFHDNDHPFGGIQLILVGDFCQLPPVCRAEDRYELRAANYQSEFAFSAHSFQLQNFQRYELTEVLRQKDDLYFMEILNAARFGNMTVKMIRDLNKRVGEPQPLAITLTANNKQADEINDREMNRIDYDATMYHAMVNGDWPEKTWPLPASIRMKPTAQVIVRKNHADRPPSASEKWESNLTNGHIGQILSIEDDHIRLVDGYRIYRQNFQRSRKVERSTETGGSTMRWHNETIAQYNQMPLLPAWAISMHKSQGQSFDRVNIDPTRVFAPGQLYVALSRARTLNGMTLIHAVDSRKFMTNKIVQLFYESI